MVASTHFTPVIEGMRRVVNENGGTARSARLDDIIICGKTGTVQNSQGQDHSVFIAFAPMDNPKIAIAVFVENGYWGKRWAGPITSLMIEKYVFYLNLQHSNYVLYQNISYFLNFHILHLFH